MRGLLCVCPLLALSGHARALLAMHHQPTAMRSRSRSLRILSLSSGTGLCAIARGNKRDTVARPRRLRTFARLSFAGKGCDHSVTDCDVSCARPFEAGTLATDAGAFEQERQGISEQLWLRNPSFMTKLCQTVALLLLELLNDVSRRMIAFGQFHGDVGQIATATIVDNAFGAHAHQALSCASGSPG